MAPGVLAVFMIERCMLSASAADTSSNRARVLQLLARELPAARPHFHPVAVYLDALTLQIGLRLAGDRLRRSPSNAEL